MSAIGSSLSTRWRGAGHALRHRIAKSGSTQHTPPDASDNAAILPGGFLDRIGRLEARILRQVSSQTDRTGSVEMGLHLVRK